MKLNHQREAFSMMTAIIVILLMASVGSYVLSTSSKIVQETGAQYQTEQAALYAKSYTEYAILAATANESNTSNCFENIDDTIGTPIEAKGYNIRIRVAYIGETNLINGCDALRQLDTVDTESTPLQIIVDAYIEYKDSNHPDIPNAPYTTYHKRTLQKI